MRDFIYAANWKMNKNPVEALQFFRDFEPLLEKKSLAKSKRVVFFVPDVNLSTCVEALKGKPIELGGQNIHAQVSGAFTGETSAAVLESMGVAWALIGHSERRTLFGETDAMTADKVKTALANGLSAMLCVGETLVEREGGDTLIVVARQLELGLAKVIDVVRANPKRLAIAYEPVWAIGTGKVASPEQASEVHQAIRKWLTAKFDAQVAGEISILYGGSVKPDNAKSIGEKPDIDGFLVGGASLEPASFIGLM
jgi:triosephosphate isomerase